MMKSLKSVGALTVICAVVAILLAATNFVTAPIIEANDAAAANEALLVVMPNGTGFEPVDLTAYTLPSTVTAAYNEASGGCVVQLKTAGYSPDMIIMVGVDADGVVTGATCLSSGETLGYEKTYGETTVGATIETVDSLDTVGGATKTTAAYRGAVKDALNSYIILNGGSVDVRTDAEILADNLNAALPAAEGAFTQWFITEKLETIDAVYIADNGIGYVFVSGEEFIGVNIAMSALPEGIDRDELDVVLRAVNSELTEIDLSSYENIPSQVLAAYKTASGNYVFDLRAAGFGINGDKYYNPSGEYIMIKVSATVTGEIIDTLTVSQAESEGFGSACAEESFYSQFDGKTADNYTEIDAISGATITTNGYKTAVGKVFETIKILEGAAE